jgi:hypothetical protein
MREWGTQRKLEALNKKESKKKLGADSDDTP